MRDCAKHFLIVSPIAPISSRLAPTPIASDAPSSGRRKNSTDEPVQMTGSGKPGKQESCFPPFPLSLEIPKSGIPTFTQLRLFLSRSNHTLKPRGQHSLEKGGQIWVLPQVPCIMVSFERDDRGREHTAIHGLGAMRSWRDHTFVA